jgi:hypothetical protein
LIFTLYPITIGLRQDDQEENQSDGPALGRTTLNRQEKSPLPSVGNSILILYQAGITALRIESIPVVIHDIIRYVFADECQMFEKSKPCLGKPSTVLFAT